MCPERGRYAIGLKPLRNLVQPHSSHGLGSHPLSDWRKLRILDKPEAFRPGSLRNVAERHAAPAILAVLAQESGCGHPALADLLTLKLSEHHQDVGHHAPR